jgi:hypothetical protein
MVGLEAAFAGAGGEVAAGVGRGGEAGEGDVDAQSAQLEAEIERRFGGPRPLPVAEEMQDAHGRIVAVPETLIKENRALRVRVMIRRCS